MVDVARLERRRSAEISRPRESCFGLLPARPPTTTCLSGRDLNSYQSCELAVSARTQIASTPTSGGNRSLGLFVSWARSASRIHASILLMEETKADAGSLDDVHCATGPLTTTFCPLEHVLVSFSAQPTRHSWPYMPELNRIHRSHPLSSGDVPSHRDGQVGGSGRGGAVDTRWGASPSLTLPATLLKGRVREQAPRMLVQLTTHRSLHGQGHRSRPTSRLERESQALFSWLL